MFIWILFLVLLILITGCTPIKMRKSGAEPTRLICLHGVQREKFTFLWLFSKFQYPSAARVSGTNAVGISVDTVRKMMFSLHFLIIILLRNCLSACRFLVFCSFEIFIHWFYRLLFYISFDCLCSVGINFLLVNLSALSQLLRFISITSKQFPVKIIIYQSP